MIPPLLPQPPHVALATDDSTRTVTLTKQIKEAPSIPANAMSRSDGIRQETSLLSSQPPSFELCTLWR